MKDQFTAWRREWERTNGLLRLELFILRLACLTPLDREMIARANERRHW